MLLTKFMAQLIQIVRHISQFKEAFDLVRSHYTSTKIEAAAIGGTDS